MKPTDCSRAWQAEAVEDGRLSVRDRASFERHRPTCEHCKKVVAELALLRGIGMRHAASPTAPLEHRRARNELLRLANELTVRAPKSIPWRGLAAALAVVSLVAVLAIRLTASRPAAPASVAAPSYHVLPSQGAEWRTLEHGSKVRLAVTRGHFEIAVRHLSAGQRFTLELPDGELEVQGTRFVVEVDGRRTLGVEVLEGRVALRVRERGRALVTLGPGESFRAASGSMGGPEATAPGQPSEMHALTLPSAPASRFSDARPELPDPRASRERTPGTANDTASAAASASGRAAVGQPARSAAPANETVGSAATSGADFARAMSAFSAGDYGQAEKLFQRFASEHTTDTRVEDAMFLSAVARARRGDVEGSRALAAEYLRRYPNGLRRIEAERLVE